MRGWHEFVAALGDWAPGGVPGIALFLLIVTAIGIPLWYWFPEWVYGLVTALRRVGRGVASWRLPRRKRRDKRKAPAEQPRPEPAVVADEELPDVPAAALAVTADELAAQGRYKEAVRERLRAIVRDLVERQVIEHHPGWTVTELAGAAGRARPATAAPLGAASEVFSAIWYGQRDATALHDAVMREHAERVRAALDGRQVPV